MAWDVRMSFLNKIPGTDIKVSALGFGTVKIGRNQSVKYPDTFTIPDDYEVKNILALAKELGINLIDTAPAYGLSESRIGHLLENRQDWVITTKVGEEFEDGVSSFDFSAKHTRASIERSLRRLSTDYLDIVLIHSDGNDDKILQQGDCVRVLQECQQQGLIRAIGMSTKTISGGIQAASLMDIVMLTYNLQQQDQAVVDFATEHNKGILIKKGLMSGHIGKGSDNPIRKSMEFIFNQTAINSVIIGTINPGHLKENVKIAKEILG
jgi:aryl-alcohol dehydrogenase-like predicted oxidoreductase